MAFFGAAGSYAEAVVLPAAGVVPVPREVEIRSAVTLTLQGMTAHYLTKDAYKLTAGEKVLIHAGAGGTGLLLIQIAKLIGAEVFGAAFAGASAAPAPTARLVNR